MPILQLCEHPSPRDEALWAAAVDLVGPWPDPTTQDMTLLTSPTTCSPQAPCAGSTTAVHLLTADGGDLASSELLSAPSPTRRPFLVASCSHDARSVQTGYYVAEREPPRSLANAIRLTPILLRRARATPTASGTRPEPPPVPEPERPSGARGSTALAQALARWTRTREWRVGVAVDPSRAGLQRGATPGLVWLDPPGHRRFWADPWPAVDPRSGERWIMVEEYDRWEGRGRIVALRWSGRRITERRIVLAGTHHHALPHARRVEGRWVATTDTCQTPAPVYTFAELGDPWIPIPGATLPGFLSDPVLTWAAGSWRVTGTNWCEDENAACETWVTHGRELRSWTRVDAHGYADPRSARNGGPTDPALGVRVTQDCVGSYGRRVVLLPTGEPPQAPARTAPVPAHPSHEASGSHTLAWDPDLRLAALDVWWDRIDPLARVWALRDQRHLLRCRAQSAAPSARPWRVIRAPEALVR